MSTRRFEFIASILLVTSSPGWARADAAPLTKVKESLYAFHNVRTSRVTLCAATAANPTACAAIQCPVGSLPSATYLQIVEDTQDLYSFIPRRSNGRIVDTLANSIGVARLCFGVISIPPMTPTVRLSYVGEYHLGHLDFTVTGYCDGIPSDPVPTATTYTCYGEASGAGLVGGHLVANSANGPDPVPAQFNPDTLGLHENSFSIARLWHDPNAPPRHDDDGDCDDDHGGRDRRDRR